MTFLTSSQSNVSPPYAHLAPPKTFKDFASTQLRVASTLTDIGPKPISDNNLAILDDNLKRGAGLGIATLATFGLTRRVFGVGEYLGFLSWFGAMAATPKIINGLVRGRTGVNLNQDYINTNKERHNLYKDPKYLPLHLIPDYEIIRIADKLKIPRHLPNRREITEERIREIATQSKTWWMLVAGPATPVISGLLCDQLQQPTIHLLNRMNTMYHFFRASHTRDPQKLTHHVQHHVRQLVGEIPNSKISQWWKGFGVNMVNKTGLNTAFSIQDIVNAPAHEQKKTLLSHFETLGQAEQASRRQELQQYLKKQRVFLSHLSEEASVLLKKQGIQLDKSIHANAQQLIEERITNARATVSHYEALLQELDKGKPTVQTLKALMDKPGLPEIQSLVEKGQVEQAKKLAGNEQLYQEARQLINQGQFGKAFNRLGASPSQHLLSALKDTKLRTLWQKRIIGYLGGGMLLATMLYTQFFVGRRGAPKPATNQPAATPPPTSQPKFGWSQPSAIPQRPFTTTPGIGINPYYRPYYGSYPSQPASRVIQPTPVMQSMPPRPPYPWQNQLKNLFKNNQAVIYALHLRTFGAEDKNNDGRISFNHGESGSFLSAISKLDELKDLGVNTIHLLPIHPPGDQKRLGEAGSVYAPASYLELNPEYDTPGNRLSVLDEARIFVQEAHKRGIHVMADVPSCASIDLAQARPDLIARDRNGNLKTPANWIDIAMFETNPALVKYYADFFDLMVNKVGVDGFRVDVARARPLWFWQHFTSKYPHLGWLAESYTEEDASPMENIPRDVPEGLLKSGFDSIYGQFHIFHKMRNANEYMQYLKDGYQMFNRAGSGKSFIGSFLTHDDPALMTNGGTTMSFLASGLMATQPLTNPYILDGFTTGFSGHFDIFNFAKRPKGNHPEIGIFLKHMLSTRKQYQDVLSKGLFIPVPVQNAENNQIIAFARHLNGKTLLVVANKDVNARHSNTLHIPGFRQTQSLKDLSLPYGRSSHFIRGENQLKVDLGPGRFHLFEIDTPYLPSYLPSYP